MRAGSAFSDSSESTPCRCSVVEVSGSSRLDSSACLLEPILDVFGKIQERAREIADSEPSRRTEQKVPRNLRSGTGEDLPSRWKRAQAAFAHAYEVLEEEKIPTAPLTCGFCRKPITEGSLWTFHGACYDERFVKSADLRPLK